MAGANLTKAEEIERMVAAAVNAGEERHLETVDFGDPNRPKTCLEVDFPILPINEIAKVETNKIKDIFYNIIDSILDILNVIGDLLAS